MTTAVQFFESLYAAKTSRCRKLHSIAGSVVIFDEAQMLPMPYLRPCVFTIAELARHYGVTAVLCTATQPALDKLFKEYAPELKITEIMEHRKELYTFFKRVTFQQEGTLSEEALCEQLVKEEQALCIVNTRKIAQRLMEAEKLEQYPDAALENSASVSRQTSLPLANASRCRARSGLSPPSCCSCRLHFKMGLPQFSSCDRPCPNIQFPALLLNVVQHGQFYL